MNKIATAVTAATLALTTTFTAATPAAARDRDTEKLLLGLGIGIIIGNGMNNGGNFGTQIIPQGKHYRIPQGNRVRTDGVYLSCDDKFFAYDTAFQRAARDGKVTTGEHNSLERIRQTPVSYGQRCNIRRPY